MPAVDIADVKSKTSASLKMAKAKIQKLGAEVAKMQTELQLATVPVKHFRPTKNDDKTEYYTRGQGKTTSYSPDPIQCYYIA